MDKRIKIGSRVYGGTSDGEYEIPLSEIESLRFVEVPYYSTLHILLPLPMSPIFTMIISATHAGGRHNEEFTLSIKISFSIPGDQNSDSATGKCLRLKDYVRRSFHSLVEESGFHAVPDWIPYFQGNGQIHALEAYYRDYTREENPILAVAVIPFIKHFEERLASFKDTLLFICHASEDKAFVDSLCSFLDLHQIAVWYDKREIRVGDSIVERINDGLDSATHMVIVLSRNSVKKPWVKKEFSAALMRQLQDAAITVLPLVLDGCQLPPLLADIRYADCRENHAQGFNELIRTVS
jgi:hypothetical protein